MNRTKIEWCDMTWNPVMGCRTGCPYCYGKRLNDRFGWIEKWDEPKFFPERLNEPFRVKKPSTIFVGSMCDLFGDWIFDSVIELVIEVCKNCYWHKFMFLTKYPKRYLEFNFPSNCWLGTTVDYAHNSNRISWLEKYDKGNVKKFVSVEPLLSRMHLVDFSKMDLVIVGAMTGMRAVKPQKDWIYSIKHDNIFYKDNIKPYL